jgi:DNA-binding transcriptional ArsR family regulator
VTEPTTADAADAPVRVAGLGAMRALAHPTRVRMMHLLRTDPMSASELARRLGIAFGSARYHLRTLEQAGIARRVGERPKRGGLEILFDVPRSTRVDLDAEAPLEVREGVYRAYLAELGRRLEASAAEPEPEDSERDVLTTREVELRPRDIPAAAEALEAFLRRLEELGLDGPDADSIPLTVAVQFFRVPRSASQHPLGNEA